MKLATPLPSVTKMVLSGMRGLVETTDGLPGVRIPLVACGPGTLRCADDEIWGWRCPTVSLRTIHRRPSGIL
jgi:hypothetical protein